MNRRLTFARSLVRDPSPTPLSFALFCSINQRVSPLDAHRIQAMAGAEIGAKSHNAMAVCGEFYGSVRRTPPAIQPGGVQPAGPKADGMRSTCGRMGTVKHYQAIAEHPVINATLGFQPLDKPPVVIGEEVMLGNQRMVVTGFKIDHAGGLYQWLSLDAVPPRP
jgi:hypothetical protein